MRLAVTESMTARPPRVSSADLRGGVNSIEIVHMTSPEPEVGNDGDKTTSCGRAVGCLRCAEMCARFDEILAQLRKVDSRPSLVCC